MTQKKTTAMIVALAVMWTGSDAVAQSLFQIQPAAAPAPGADVNQAEPLYAASLIALAPAQKREFHINDLVTILVSEKSDMTRDQTVESEKRVRINTARVQFPKLLNFLLLNGSPAGVTNPNKFGIEHKNRYNTDASYERSDEITGQLTARVVDVKPNGTLLLEARSVLKIDDDEQTFLVSGLVRSEDVTETNTVQSNQLYDLHYVVKNVGDMRNVSKRGLITRALDALFNF